MPNQLKLMVIEDEELLLSLIEHKLQNNHITAFAYPNAEKGLEHFIEHKEKPDLIWLDFHLKGMDGLEFIKKLRVDLNIKDIPVIVISNEANEEIAKQCIDAGAAKFLVKAQNRLEDALNSINEYLKENGKTYA